MPSSENRTDSTGGNARGSIDDFHENSIRETPAWVLWICMVGVAVTILCSIGSIVFVYIFRNRPIVAMGQPQFLYVLLFGSILIPISSIFVFIVKFSHQYSVDDDDNNEAAANTDIYFNVCCNFATWFYYTGIIIMYGCLLCKIYRIMKLTSQPLRRGLKVLPRHALWPFVVVVSLTIALLLAWSLTGSSKYVSIEVPGFKGSNTTQGFCTQHLGADTQWNNPSSSKQYLTLLTILVTVVQFILLVLACKVRNVNQQLGDSKKIIRLLIFQVVFHNLFASTNAAVSHFNTTAMIIVAMLHVIMYSLSTIGFILCPRMYYVWYENKHGQLPPTVEMIGGGGRTVVRINNNNNSTTNTNINTNINTGTNSSSTTTNTYNNNNNNNNNRNNSRVNNNRRYTTGSPCSRTTNTNTVASSGVSNTTGTRMTIADIRAAAAVQSTNNSNSNINNIIKTEESVDNDANNINDDSRNKDEEIIILNSNNNNDTSVSDSISTINRDEIIEKRQ